MQRYGDTGARGDDCNITCMLNAELVMTDRQQYDNSINDNNLKTLEYGFTGYHPVHINY